MSAEGDPDSQRLCYICLDPSMPLDDSEWVHPCRCTGTMGWVHKRCILRWVRIQNAHACPQCLVPYRITPPKSALILAMEFMDNTIYPCVKIAVSFLVSTMTLEIACVGLGIFAFTQVYGADEAFRILTTSNHDETFVKLHLMSYSLLAVSAVPWEDYLLKAMKYVAQIPVLGLFLPANTSRRTPVLRSKPSISRTVARSVTLPIFGRICGNLVFNDVHDRLTRVFLGGLVYLAVKGGLYMYYTQKLMIRLDHIDVLPYIPVQRLSAQSNTQRRQTEPRIQRQGTIPSPQQDQQGSTGIVSGALEENQQRSGQEGNAQGPSDDVD